MRKEDERYMKIVVRILNEIKKFKPENDIFGQLVSLEEADRRPYFPESTFKDAIPIAQELFEDVEGIAIVKARLKKELKFIIETMETPSLEATYKYMVAYDYLRGNITTLKKSKNPCIKVAKLLMDTGLNSGDLVNPEEPVIIELCHQIDLMTKKLSK